MAHVLFLSQCLSNSKRSFLNNVGFARLAEKLKYLGLVLITGNCSRSHTQLFPRFGMRITVNENAFHLNTSNFSLNIFSLFPIYRWKYGTARKSAV